MNIAAQSWALVKVLKLSVTIYSSYSYQIALYSTSELTGCLHQLAHIGPVSPAPPPYILDSTKSPRTYRVKVRSCLRQVSDDDDGFQKCCVLLTLYTTFPYLSSHFARYLLSSSFLTVQLSSA